MTTGFIQRFSNSVARQFGKEYGTLLHAVVSATWDKADRRRSEVMALQKGTRRLRARIEVLKNLPDEVEVLQRRLRRTEFLLGRTREQRDDAQAQVADLTASVEELRVVIAQLETVIKVDAGAQFLEEQARKSDTDPPPPDDSPASLEPAGYDPVRYTGAGRRLS